MTQAPAATEPRWRFHAVDDAGRIRTGVLRAASEEEARELLLEEHLYPKRLTPAEAEEPLTWSPRRRRTAGSGAAAGTQGPPRAVRHVFSTTVLFGLPERVAGTLGMAENGDLVFTPAPAAGGEPVHIARAAVEEVRLGGWVLRTLHVAEIDGRGWEFAAGFLIAEGHARSIVKAFR